MDKTDKLEACPFCCAMPTPYPADKLPTNLHDVAGEWLAMRHDPKCFITLLGFGDYPIHQDRWAAWNTRSRALVAAPPPDLAEVIKQVIQRHNQSRTHKPTYCCPEDEAVYNRLLTRMLVDELSPVAVTVDAETRSEAEILLRSWIVCMRDPRPSDWENIAANLIADTERYVESPRTATSIQAAATRPYFCSCGGTLTAEEYIEHYFEKGHDRGDPAFQSTQT